jgi:uncharacterized protein (TIGR02246 family)
MTTEPMTIARSIYARLEAAWNVGDGDAFAAPFAEDADFVDIRGTNHKGRAEIATGHRFIFGSIYKGSTVKYEVTAARALADGVVLAHAGATLVAPTGPLAGENRASQTMVIVRAGDAWHAAAFHNTLVMT